MPAAPKSPNEESRLAAVNKVKLMGTPAEERFDQITRLAREQFGVPMVALDIVGEELAWLKSVQGFDGIEGLRRDSYCHYTVLTEGACLVKDARIDPRVMDSALAHNWVAYAGVPLHFDGERVGVLCIGDYKPRTFDSDQMEALSHLALQAEHELEVSALSESQLSLASSNVELDKKNNIDILTHLWNRQAILDIARTELRQASGEQPMAFVIIDIDNFKQLNESYGQSAGDQVLRSVSERLRKAVRPMDAIGRLGNDEYIVILANIHMNEALQLCNKICAEIANEPIHFENNTIQPTSSIGYTMSNGFDDIESLLNRSEQALYQAKLHGGNGVHLK